MKVGILGGTFDPIHQGHLIAAEWTRQSQMLDEIWFMPAAMPPHKRLSGGADASDRLTMVKTAIANVPYFKVTEIEIKRGGKSYSYETILELKKRHPHVEFYFIIGADMVQYLPHWHQIEQLVTEITFIGLERAGVSINWGELPSVLQSAVKMSPMPDVGISSSLIRERCQNQQSIRFLVHESVYEYIKENRLYED